MLAGACRWDLPDLRRDDAPYDDLVGRGADLEPATLVRAYSLGLFPMPDAQGLLGSRRPTWWCPVRRGVLPLDGVRVSRSLRRSARTMEVRVDTAFVEVVEGCADPSRDGGWIDDGIASAYLRLHELGLAHSVEAWRDGELVGGLYGVSIGGLFAGESMFHRATDASKVALLGLVEVLRDEHAADRVLDVQWATPHLTSLGVVEVPRPAYLSTLLPRALALPPPAWP